MKKAKDIEEVRTMYFMILSLSQIIQVYNMQSHYSLFEIAFFINHYLNKRVLISLDLVLVILYLTLLTYLLIFEYALILLVIIKTLKTFSTIK